MLVRNFIFWLSTKRSVTDRIARHGMKNGFARRFVAGESLDEALTASQELCSQGRNVSLESSRRKRHQRSGGARSLRRLHST